MAKIQILGQFDCVTEDKLLAVAEQIKYADTTVALALAGKQNSLTFDNTPTQNSSNPVTSGGLYTKLETMDAELKAYADGASSSANVTLRTVTVSKSGWAVSGGHPRYSNNILPGSVETKKYYDVHLASSVSGEVSILCAKSDIRVVQESNGLFLHAYNPTSDAGWSNNAPSFDFTIEIITIPITSNVTGLSYDIGDDFVINVTKDLDTRLSTAENSLGSSSDAASSLGTTAWSRLKQAQADITSINTKIGSSTDTASSSSTVVWPRIKSIESNITTLQDGLGTSSDAASASGTTAWSRIKQLQSDVTTSQGDITSLKNEVGTSSDTASSSGTTAWSRIKQVQSDITIVQGNVTTLQTNVTALQNGLGTSSDAASATGATAWSRIKQNASDIADIQAAIGDIDFSSMILYTSNKSVATSAWVASNNVDYPFSADIAMTGLSASYFPIVQFEDEDVQTFALSGKVVPKTNAITIYCKTKPNREITVPNIICFKGQAV